MGIESKLDKKNIENVMSLTSLQQGILFHYISDEQSNMYHEQLSLTVKGDLKLDLLQKSWQSVIDNNEMLRTIFRWKGIDKPVQIVLKKNEVLIQYFDLTNELYKHSSIENIKSKDFNNRIDITRETLRIYLCKLDEYTHEMIISNHHILYDGWSNGIILKELMETYSCLYKGKNVKKINKTRFSEFIKYINNLNKDEEKNYWSNYLQNLDNKDDCFSCKEVGMYKEVSYKMDENKENKIKDFAKANKVLLSSILYGAWGVLLQKLSNSNDVLFGTTVSGRPENIKSIDNMVGLFINTIPLRAKSENDTTFINLIHDLDKVLDERKGFENTSLVDIKEYCGFKGNEEMFNSIVTIENYPIDLNLNKQNMLSIENFSIIEKTNYNMGLEILTFNGIEFKFNFNSLSIEESIVKKLGKYLEKIINALLNNSNIRIKEVDLLSDQEKNQILYEFNDTKVDYEKDKTIQELFEEQVEKTPDNIAVVFEDKKLTYRELNEKANSVARVLRNKGVKADSIVGIMVERSIEMILGIMGTLKSGGAYLPIDSSYPKERIEYMLKDSESKVLLSTESLVTNIEFNGEIIDLFNEDLFTGESSNLDEINNSSNLAYVIYTSGTTGNPKGVMIEHRSVNNLVQSLRKNIYFMYKNQLRVVIVAQYYFDASVQQIFGALIGGDSLYIVPEDIRKNGEELLKYYERNSIDISDGTPIHLNMISNLINIKSRLNLKHFIIGGDKLSKESIMNIYEKFPGIKVSNVYGPTECCVDSSIYLVESNKINLLKNIPIGKPIENSKAYIVDKNINLMPIGITGELCLSGDGLARGYLNKPELTAEKFVDNPFEIGTKMYKTGDLARWLPDGNIEFLGRIDNQVKIRGFRIELGEIENRLLRHESIKEAVVLVKENKEKEKYICAYVVSKKSLEELNLKNYLKETLPEYMVPAYFVQLEKMPLTSNGKLDRRALPEPNLDNNLNEYEAPRNELEEALVKIWNEVLGVKKIGINDNFFELGGHSLKATVLMSKIHKELNKEVPLKELFKAPTIKELSKFIKSAEENLYSKIEKVEGKEYYEASSAQKRMYMLQQFDKDSTAYNMPAVFVLEGKVDKNKIEETFKKLTERHDALRTYFETFNDEIMQKLQNNHEFRLVHRNESGNIEDIINSFIRPFDLEKVPLFRVEFVENKEKTYLLIDMHHIISDGVSMSILINEFRELYSGKTLEPLKLQYKDFAAWQNNFLKSEEMKKQEEYWINRFSDEIPVLNMSTDYERPVMQSFEGDSVTFEVDEETTSKLRKLIKETGTTIHMTLLSTFNILLSKYSEQEDIVIGTPIAGRPHADLQNIIGMFVNTLALRNKPEGDKKYIDFLKEVKENSLKAYENQSYQLEALVEKLNLKRDTSRNPLFDVMFNMIDTVTGEDIKLDDILLKKYNSGNKISKFDLTLNAMENDKKLNFNIEYCTKLFKKETIERLSSHYVKVLETIINNTEIKLCEVDLLSEQERNQILYEFNDTRIDYPKDKTIQELFEEQVGKTPDNIAVVFEDKKLTYKELNEKANSLARVLREKGVKADSIVGIMVERSLEMIVGIMAILKSGGSYLPIDPSYPKDRIEYMLKDSESKILLSRGTLVKNVEFDGDVIDLFKDGLFTGDFSNLEKINNSGNLAYVIYTSGTTGRPKGVMIYHSNIVNTIYWRKNHYVFNELDAVLQIPSFSFDSSVEDILTPLISGSRLVIIDQAKRLDINYLKVTIFNNNITNFLVTPALYNTLLDDSLFEVKSLKKVTVAGEDVHQEIIRKHFKLFKDVKLFNEYGPTENSVCSTIYEINGKGKEVFIGKPISNTKVYILDKFKNILPIGVAGELCLSGDGLARGYLNKPELTIEKFVDNPFEAGTKMYKTGDLARWLPDGNIRFLGRIDNQVKIRGFRIELGEIENRLLQHESVKEAAAVAKENKEKDKYICVYVTSEKDLRELNLRNYLKETLPEYMVPAYFVQLEKMPLTSNGKLDRRALPEPNLDGNLNEYESPRNELEEALVKIWSEVLGVKKIGINDNFFELGGHSLKATVLMSKIHKGLNKEIPLKELFKAPTIKELSKFIESTEENLYSNIEKVEENEYYEVSSAQKRMYMLQQFDKDSTAYNMPVVFELEGEVDKARIEETFKKLSIRHEALRTYFETYKDQIIQKVDYSYAFKLVDGKCNEEIDTIINKFIRPFDLGQVPLFRVELVENKEKTYLLIDMHHIISDGVSMSILIKEFKELYNGEELERLRLQYKDFAAWQNAFLKSEEIKNQEEYWTNRFGDEIPVLNLPYDYERPAMQSFVGDSVSYEVDEKTTEELRKLAKETGTTMHMVLLSIFNILLSKYSGQEDIIVGTPIAGRSHADIQNIMGMFVNTLALRNKPEGDKKYIDFLKEVKENSLKAYENQSYQLEALVEKLNLKRDTSRNPLFDVMFNMIDTVTVKDIKLVDILFKQYDSGNKISKFDLTLNALESDTKLNFTIEYCSKLFKKETIERLSRHYVKILDTIVSNREIKLCEVDLLSEAERNQILYEFNDTKVDYPKDKTIQELFEDQVEKTPDNIAVVFEDKKLTYRELNEKANSLARVLRDKGVKADSIVGIMVERSVEMIIGIMAVLKSGGAYLPIDLNYPKERIEYILKDSESKILLSKNTLLDNIEFDGEIINLFNEELFISDSSNVEKINDSSNLAYVIYTSGTTGKPKGVLIEHLNLNNFINCFNMQFNQGFSSKDKILSLTNYVFDVSVCEIFTSLTSGATLVINDKHKTFDPQEIGKLIVDNRITFTYIPPSLLANVCKVLKEFKNNVRLNKLLVGVEAIKGEVLNRFYEINEEIEIVNGYGPTEATICSTFYKVTRNEERNKYISIGKTIGNTDIYLLNRQLSLVPVGAVGEIFVSGNAVGRGYQNRSSLTTQKFINDPFKVGRKMYKTGDLARWLSNGNIEFIGRIDNQVKIRGYRIEIEEIEKCISMHEAIEDVAVVVKVSTDTKELCAFIIEKYNMKIEDLRKYINKKLPEYMIPARFVKLDKMPLTNNGKVDKKLLANKIYSYENDSIYAAPNNDFETKICDILCKTLGISRISVEENLFNIGLDSFKSIQLISNINKMFDTNLTVDILFERNTIRKISNYIYNYAENKKSINSVSLVFNKEGIRKIYTFPPVLGQGIAYKRMAEFLEGCTTIAFNFIRNKNRVMQYADIIEKLSPERDIIMLAHSVGGLLAYDVAIELVKRGKRVTDIIFMDVLPGDGVYQTDEMILEEIDQKIGDKYKLINEYLGESYSKGELRLDCLEYTKYYHSHKFDKQIDTKIHFISSESVNAELILKICKETYRKLTGKEVSIYQGYGKHKKMLDSEFALKNSYIVKSILNVIEGNK